MTAERSVDTPETRADTIWGILSNTHTVVIEDRNINDISIVLLMWSQYRACVI